MKTTTNAPGRALFVICLSSACWAFSFGLAAPLASLWLKQAGCNDTIIGLNTAIYYAGLTLAAIVVPFFMRVWGPASSTVGMVFSGLTLALFPWGNTLTWWFGIRLLNGMAGALSVIPMETYVNRDLSPEHRGRNFGLYAVALALGWALGNWVGLDMVATMPHAAFIVGGLSSLAGAALAMFYLPPIHLRGDDKTETLAIDPRDNLLSFGSAWCQGFLEGGMIAFMSLYLINLSYSEQQAGWLISTTMIGVIVFQAPVTWLGDFLGKQPVLLGCYALVAAGLVAIPLAGTSALLPIALFVVGACSGAFYPLGLALLGENLPAAQLDRANAFYLSVEGLGCIAGPAVMGLARDQFGQSAMFIVGEAALLLVLAGWLTFRPREAPVAASIDQIDSSRRAA